MYAKVFRQIFDSSIADDYRVRLVFEDLLKLADPNGVVDMTREAISRVTNVPLELVNQGIAALESPDPKSRSAGHEGRRIVLLDEHRDWGWIIVNYDRYRRLGSEEQRRENTRTRVKHFRDRERERGGEQVVDVKACNADVTSSNVSHSTSSSSFTLKKEGIVKGGKSPNPGIEAVKLQGAKIGLPDIECEKFFDYYEANGWRVGKNPMRLWTAALANWKRHWLEYSTESARSTGPPQPSADTFWKDKARLDMIEKEIQAIEGRASHTAMNMLIEPQDKDRYKRLKSERRDLKAKMKL